MKRSISVARASLAVGLLVLLIVAALVANRSGLTGPTDVADPSGASGQARQDATADGAQGAAGGTTVAAEVPAYRLVVGTSTQVRLVDSDGTSAVPVARAEPPSTLRLIQVNPGDGELLWAEDSPGGTAYRGSRFDGTTIGTLTPPADADVASGLVVSPDGDWLYYATQTPGAPQRVIWRIMRRPIAGGAPQVVRELGNYGVSLLTVSLSPVSPDGTTLAYTLRTFRGLPQRFTVGVRGAGYAQLAEPNGPPPYVDRLVWSPDSRSVLMTAAQNGGGPDHIWRVGLDRAVTDLGPLPVVPGAPEGRRSTLRDWSADGRTILVQSWDDRLIGVDAATGVATSYAVSGDGFFAGTPVVADGDTTAPVIDVASPDCGNRAAAECRRWRATVAAWGTARGPVVDQGGPFVGRVVVRAFGLHAGAWYGLVGRGASARWQQFAGRVAAKAGATDRTATVRGGIWSVDLPGLQTGRLSLLATAVDEAGNAGQGHRTVDLLQR